MRFFIATPQPTPRRTCPTSAVSPAPPGRRIASWRTGVDGLPDRHRRHRQRRRLADAAGDRSDALHDLPGDQPVAGLHGVAQADLDRVEPARRGQQVHLALVGEARLHDAEPAHRPARQVVGAHGVAVDDGVGTAVRALGVRDRVEQHGRRRRGEGTAVEHEPGLDLDQPTVGGGVVSHPDLRRVAVDVAEEALRPAVGHAHGPPQPQGQQARVDLQADVLPRSERPADAAQHEPHPVVGEPEAGGDLLAVLVQPLGGDVQLDAETVVVGNRDRGLEAEEGLVLHADLVRALDDDLADGVDVAAADALVAQDVAVGMDRWVIAGDRRLGIEQRLQHLVGDVDGRQRPPARLRMIGGDGGDGLPDVADVVAGEHGLVGGDQPVRLLARHVGGGDHRLDARHLPRRGHVDRHDAGVRVRRAQRRAPHRAVDREIRRERECTLGLDDPVRARSASRRSCRS